MNKLSILATVYKNEANIMPFYEEVIKNVVPYVDDYEIIMVNDDSPDNSWDIMKELAEKDAHIKIIRHSRNFGAHEALFTACKYATGDCVSEKSLDLQEPSSLIIDMYNAWKAGNKVVIAVRKSRNDGWINDLFSNLYYRFVRKYINKDMPLGGFDIWLMDKKVTQNIIELNERNSPLSLQLLWLGYHPVMIGYDRQERRIGKSSWTLSKKIKLFVDSLIAFSYVPIRFMSIVGFSFFVISIIWAISLLIDKINGTVPVRGFTTITILLLFSSGMIMCTLGILGEYIWRTMEAAKRRPLAIVEEVYTIKEERVDAYENIK